MDGACAGGASPVLFPVAGTTPAALSPPLPVAAMQPAATVSPFICIPSFTGPWPYGYIDALENIGLLPGFHG